MRVIVWIVLLESKMLIMIEQDAQNVEANFYLE